MKHKDTQNEAADRPAKPGKPGWLKITIGVNIAVVMIVGLFAILFGAGSYVVHLSDTSPQFCATCHIMQPNVNSYLTSTDLDHVHQQAGVQCKDCHDYPLSAEITSGVKFILGDYTVDKTGVLTQRKYDDQMCIKCHISEQHVAQHTDFLVKNPHNSHNGQLPCNTCHVSHGEQIDFCSQCHSNGGQRMTGQPATPRETSTD